LKAQGAGSSDRPLCCLGHSGVVGRHSPTWRTGRQPDVPLVMRHGGHGAGVGGDPITLEAFVAGSSVLVASLSDEEHPTTAVFGWAAVPGASLVEEDLDCVGRTCRRRVRARRRRLSPYTDVALACRDCERRNQRRTPLAHRRVRIRKVGDDLIEARVRDDTARIYSVGWDRWGWSDNCDTRSRCSHIRALQLVVLVSAAVRETPKDVAK
jgi:hypothetical protein